MNIYTPTYLYIKEHSTTGKLYFGKTTKDPEKYLGSGLHWLRHIKTHGKEHVVTLWYCLFLDQESCTEFALNFSEQQNIVESTDWLNLKPENGLDGGTVKGSYSHSIETKSKIAKAMIGRKCPKTQEHIEKHRKALKGYKQSKNQGINISKATKGIPHSKNHNDAVSKALKGVAKIRASCILCKKETSVANIKLYHSHPFTSTIVDCLSS